MVIARRVRVPTHPRGIGATVNGDGVVAASFHRRRCRTAVVTHRFGYGSFPSDGGDGGGGGGGGSGGGGGGGFLASTVLAVAAAHDSAATPVSVTRVSRRTVLQAMATESIQLYHGLYLESRKHHELHIQSTLATPLNMASRVRSCPRNRASTTVRHGGATPRSGLKTCVLSVTIVGRQDELPVLHH